MFIYAYVCKCLTYAAGAIDGRYSNQAGTSVLLNIIPNI